jgi:hypothetical protein
MEATANAQQRCPKLPLRAALLSLLVFLAACAQPRDLPTAPPIEPATAAAAPQLAAIPPEPLMPAYKASPAEPRAQRKVPG